jgi:phosphoglycolate phosphatase-like HAD superfamily hydrolase
MTTILFDVDGVFLSEERCFDVSALTVEELLYSPRYLNLDGRKFRTDYTNEEISRIRSTIFADDRVLKRFKEAGLNSNWDMLFITFAILYIDILKEEKLNLADIDITNLNEVGDMLGEVTVNPEAVLEFISRETFTKDEIYNALIEYAGTLQNLKDSNVFRMYGPIWEQGRYKYQEWYLGSELVEADTGRAAEELEKTGFIYDEEWIVDTASIKEMLNSLKDKGYTIGVATGRPRQETLLPFEEDGLIEVFDERRISTASEVMDAEGRSNARHALTKPHPFSYLWSLYVQNDALFDAAVNGRNESDEQIFIVGDSVADFYCADKIGATFIATLTGLTGDDIISTFEELDVPKEQMLKDVLGVPELVEQLAK